jgi:nitrogen regulatory protein P-II 1
MNLVIAVVRPELGETMQAALAGVRFCHLTLSEVWSQGRERGQTFIYRSTTFRERCVRRLKIEVAVDDSEVDDVVEAIQGCTDLRLDEASVVSVVPVERFIHIGTARARRRR